MRQEFHQDPELDEGGCRHGDKLVDCATYLCICRLFDQEENEQLEVLLVRFKSCGQRAKLTTKRTAGTRRTSRWKGL
jgi:hypothetical protein